MKWIGVYDNAFSDNWCDAVVESFEAYNAQEDLIGKVLKDGNGNPSPDLQMESIPSMKPMADVFYKKILQYYGEYAKQFPVLKHSPEHFPTNIKIRKVLSEGYSNRGWHYELQNASIHFCGRVVTYLIYLNDIEEGGGTKFKDQNFIQPAKKGTVIFFPTSYTHTHAAEAPIKPKEKYIITGWMKWTPVQNGQTY